GQTGNAFQQDVAADEQRDDQAVDDGLLSDDGAGHFGAETGDGFVRGGDLGRDRAGVEGGGHGLENGVDLRAELRIGDGADHAVDDLAVLEDQEGREAH